MNDFKRRLLYGEISSMRKPKFGPFPQVSAKPIRVDLAKATLSASERGLIVSSPIKIGKDRSLNAAAALDREELRFALLFWDKLDWPDNTMISLNSAGDADFLRSTGVLCRSLARFDSFSGGAGDLMLQAFVATFRARDLDRPGAWSLARGPKSISFDDDDLEQGRGVLFELHKAIPVPDREVPLAEVQAEALR
jgi:hypothetical protein